MKSIEDKILFSIYGHGVGYAFSSSDFIDKYSLDSINKALSTLTQQGKIRRLMRGVYDYPKYSEFLNQVLAPDIEQVAAALARKFNWQIEVSGETALNILGLSTQVPGRYIFLSNGPNKVYALENNMVIEFKKSSLKNIGFKYKKSSLLVQALKTLGKEHVDDKVIDMLSASLEAKECKKILSDTKTTTIWIYEMIKKICEKSNSDE